MITLEEINAAVNRTVGKALKGLFPYPVPIVAEDLSEPIIRPSVKVIFEGAASGRFNSQCRERTITCRIYFFAKDRKRYKYENMKVQEALEGAFFDGLTIHPEFIVPIEEVESNVSDSVLICSINLDMIEILPDTDTGELMEELVFQEKGGE